MEEGVTHDNCCSCHTAAILKITDSQRQDVIYASFFNRVSTLRSSCNVAR